MYMTGVKTDEEFAEIIKGVDVRPSSSKLDMPYFVMAGEDDSLSDIECTFEHLNYVSGPKTLFLYAGEEHGIFGARSSQLGVPFFTVIADWLADRASDKPMKSTFNVVDSNGQLHTERGAKTGSINTELP